MNTMLCQLKSLLLLGVLLFANGAFGQPMIWDDTSPETIVFELTNKEALKLLKGKLRQKQWDKIQQTPFARFTDAWSNPPVKGHFLLADVERNEVHYLKKQTDAPENSLKYPTLSHSFVLVPMMAAH